MVLSKTIHLHSKCGNRSTIGPNITFSITYVYNRRSDSLLTVILISTNNTTLGIVSVNFNVKRTICY